MYRQLLGRGGALSHELVKQAAFSLLTVHLRLFVEFIQVDHGQMSTCESCLRAFVLAGDASPARVSGWSNMTYSEDRLPFLGAR